MVGLTPIPQWLQALLGEKFFIPCSVHLSEKKCEKNTFCLDCCISLCSHCLLPHRTHRLLQIRRYVYQDVIRLNEAQKLMDCSFVQPYTTNSAKVVFLNQRPMTRQFKVSGNICSVCDRNLQEPYLFCSISCKFQVHRTAASGKGHLCNSDAKGLRFESCLELDGGQMTPESVLELAVSIQTSSGSSSSNVGGLNCSRSTLACTATTEFVRRKRSAISGSRSRHRVICAPAPECPDGVNRRKRVPHRSPLY
ncbi:protein RGF1 INDUCIBLE TRANSCRIPTION FACTOR 1-like isoform X2 [Diospyros lotus]|uniref:protein RGF1 INDUCIBLE TRANSCRIPTION FACTOR 1-like isoform X2 n=1 Tax=Diospyros lotus TaxID=55363 RepID=UPI00224DBF86|nr:protein RGF1 INDUCIBLE TRANSCRIPTION FACTOR 1-like isoform X2 [Diospyros lotus]